MVDLWDVVPNWGRLFWPVFSGVAKLRWVLPWRQPVTAAQIAPFCALYDTQHLHCEKSLEVTALQNSLDRNIIFFALKTLVF